jgi:regulatory protein
MPLQGYLDAGCDPRAMSKGDALEESLLESLRASQTGHDCFRKGLLLSSRSEQSASMLASKLAARGYPRPCIEKAIDRLSGLGYIDEGRFAAAFIASRVATKPVGPVSLLAGLRRRGVSPQIAAESLASAFPEDKRREALNASIEGLVKRGLREKALYIKLRRIGFRHSEIVEKGILPPRDA